MVTWLEIGMLSGGLITWFALAQLTRRCDALSTRCDALSRRLDALSQRLDVISKRGGKP